MIIKKAFFAIATCVFISSSVKGQDASQGANTADAEARVLRHDYPQVAVVAHVWCDTAQAVGRIGGRTGYITYRVSGRVIEPFKGRLRRGQKLVYSSMAEASYPAAFYRGDKILFLNLVRAKDKWVYSALENSTHQATTKNLIVMRQLRDGSNPQQQVQLFLKFHLAHGAGLNPQALQARKRWLAPKLYGLLQNEIEREAAFRAAHPHNMPFITGDVFTTSQEKVSRLRLGTVTRQKDVATVPVRFQFGPAARLVNYKLRLVQGQWLIEDIVFDGESLLKILQRPPYSA